MLSLSYLVTRRQLLRADNMMSFEALTINLGRWLTYSPTRSRLITQDQIDRLLVSGLQVISSGANVPFADPEIFYGEIAESVDERITVIPDFIANCGMARVFAYLMSCENIDMSDKAIFEDTSVIIKEALEATHAMRSEVNLLTATAFKKALNTLKQ